MQFHPMDLDEQALLDSRCKLIQDIDGQTAYERTKEYDSAQHVILLEKMINRLTQSNEVLFAVKRNIRLRNKSFHATGSGSELLRNITSVLSQIERHFSEHALTPTVATFIQHAKSLDVDIRKEVLSQLRYPEVGAAVDKLNAFVDGLRSELQTDEHRTALAKFKRNAKDNFDALVKYFTVWFQYRAKVLLLRIDLGYGELAHYIINGHLGQPYAQMAEQMQAHRDLFFKHVRKHFKGEKVGYAWKLEYGLFKGFHCHVILLLNGDKHRFDVNLTKQLGEYWKASITEGLGLYFNCNTQKHVYKYPAVGLLRACDEEKWKGLEHIARYLTKPDGYIKLELPGSSRVFGKGTRPKVPHVKRGRRRSEQRSQIALHLKKIRSRYDLTA